MTAPLRIWLEVSHHGPFRVGGWAYLRRDAGGVVGTAGGARQVDAERAGLMALVAALAGLPKGAAVEVLTASPAILAIPRRIAGGEDAPTENLDLWAQAITALAAPGLTIGPASGAPTAFAAAWAEFARDRAKDRGPFSSPIPKPNLAKAGI